MKKVLFFLLLAFTSQIVNAQSLFEINYQFRQAPVYSVTGVDSILYISHGDTILTVKVTGSSQYEVQSRYSLTYESKKIIFKNDRLYSVGSKFSIFEVLGDFSLKLISEINLPSETNETTISNNVAYLGFTDGIGIINLTDEITLNLTINNQWKSVSDLVSGSGKIVFEMQNYLYIINSNDPQNLTKIDSLPFLTEYQRSDIYSHFLLIPGGSGQIKYYDLAKPDSISLVTTLTIPSEFKFNSKIYIQENNMLRWSPFETGGAIELFQISDFPEMTLSATYAFPRSPDSFHSNSTGSIFASACSYFGLTIANYSNGKWSENRSLFSLPFERIAMNKVAFVGYGDYGYSVRSITDSQKPQLLAFYEFESLGGVPFEYDQFDFHGDTLYLMRSEYFTYSLPNNYSSFENGPMNNRGNYFRIDNNIIWFGNLESENSGVLYALEAQNIYSSETYLYLLYNSKLKHFTASNNVVYTLRPDSGIVIYKQSNSESKRLLPVQSINVPNNSEFLFMKDSVLICKTNTSNYLIFKMDSDHLFKQRSSIQGDQIYKSSFDMIDNFLIIPNNNAYRVYDLTDADNPQWVESLKTSKTPTAVSISGNKIVLGNAMNGFDILTYKGRPTSVSESNNGSNTFSLHQNYPNPFNPVTVISYRLSAFSRVSLVVYDVLGREIKTLVNENQKAGDYRVHFDATNLASGIYFATLTSKSGVKSIRMTVLK